MSVGAPNNTPDSVSDRKSVLRLDIQVLSPIHVGTREGRIGATEFVAAGGHVYLIEEDRLGRLLRDRNLIDAFIMEVRKGPFRMASFLRNTARLGIPDDLPKVCSISIPGGDISMQDFRPFVRDGSGMLYIPGTSLKGVFRTAILYRLMKSNQRLLKLADSMIRGDSDGQIQKSRKFYSEKWLQKEPLEGFDLPGGKRQSPNVDILRCLTVRDAYPVGPVQTEIIQIKFLSRLGDGTHYWSQDKKHPKDLGIWVECLTEGTFRLEMAWDTYLYKAFVANNRGATFPVSGLSDILAAVREMNKDLAEHEVDFFSSRTQSNSRDAAFEAKALKEWYQTLGEQTLRVGFGSGMLSTTVGLALEESLRQKIRDACGSGRRPSDPAPKSRRVWKRGEREVLPMGWMRLCPADTSRQPLPPAFDRISAPEFGYDRKKPESSPRRSETMVESSKETPDLQKSLAQAPKEIWEEAELRWNRGNDDLTATWQGRSATGKGKELLSQELAEAISRKQKKGKPFRAKVTVEVVGENYRKIVKVEPIG